MIVGTEKKSIHSFASSVLLTVASTPKEKIFKLKVNDEFRTKTDRAASIDSK